MAKSVIFTYLLWLVGGWFGLHHFYLRRDRHAFIWWSTMGGCFGMGWLRDIVRIPDYVADANEEVNYMRELTAIMRIREKPAFNAMRFGGEIVMGWIFGFLARVAIPEELFAEYPSLKFVVDVVIPYASAVGVHLVANVGRESGSMKIALLGAYLAFPMYFYDINNLGYCAFFSSIFVNWKGSGWKRTPPKKRGLCRRLTILSICGTIYLTLWASTLLNNAYVTTSDGEQIPLKESVKHFFKSPAWAEMKDTLKKLYENYKDKGWQKVYEDFVEAMDPEGERNAYKVLELDSGADQKTINDRCRQLSRQWHPDKHKDPEEKQKAQTKFIEIQQACDVMSTIRSRRAKRNKLKTEL